MEETPPTPPQLSLEKSWLLSGFLQPDDINCLNHGWKRWVWEAFYPKAAS